MLQDICKECRRGSFEGLHSQQEMLHPIYLPNMAACGLAEDCVFIQCRGSVTGRFGEKPGEVQEIANSTSGGPGTESRPLFFPALFTVRGRRFT